MNHDDFIRQLSERVATCSELLGKHAECGRIIAELRTENAKLREHLRWAEIDRALLTASRDTPPSTSSPAPPTPPPASE